MIASATRVSAPAADRGTTFTTVMPTEVGTQSSRNMPSADGWLDPGLRRDDGVCGRDWRSAARSRLKQAACGFIGGHGAREYGICERV